MHRMRELLSAVKHQQAAIEPPPRPETSRRTAHGGPDANEQPLDPRQHRQQGSSRHDSRSRSHKEAPIVNSRADETAVNSRRNDRPPPTKPGMSNWLGARHIR